MVAIQEQLKLPIVMHNRQWSTRSDYEHNGCQVRTLPASRPVHSSPPPYPRSSCGPGLPADCGRFLQRSAAGGEPMSSRCTWYNSAKAAAPTDPIAFFTWFFTQQQGWGLSMYEQDWMVTEYDEVQALQENITMGDLWLKGCAPLACADPCMLALRSFGLPVLDRIPSESMAASGVARWLRGLTALLWWWAGWRLGLRRPTARFSTACRSPPKFSPPPPTRPSPTPAPRATTSTPPTSGPSAPPRCSTGRLGSCRSRTASTLRTTSRSAGRRSDRSATRTARPLWRRCPVRWSGRWMGSTC